MLKFTNFWFLLRIANDIFDMLRLTNAFFMILKFNNNYAKIRQQFHISAKNQQLYIYYW